MKKIVVIGSKKSLGDRLSHRMNTQGYSIKHTQDVGKLGRILKAVSPDFVLCAGTIGIDADGNYYLEL